MEDLCGLEFHMITKDTHSIEHIGMELKIVQASKGCDVQLEFHEWQREYMTVCIWLVRDRKFNPQQQDFQI